MRAVSRRELQEMINAVAPEAVAFLKKSIVNGGANGGGVDAARVGAARIILAKCAPDLRSIDARIDVETKTNHVVEFR